LRDLAANFGGDRLVEPSEPFARYGRRPVSGARQHPRKRPGRVGVAALVDGFDEAIGKARRAEKAVDRLRWGAKAKAGCAAISVSAALRALRAPCPEINA